MDIYEKIAFLGEIEPTDRKAFSDFLSNKSFLRGLGEVMLQRAEKNTLVGLELSSSGGLVQTAERKGEVWGMLRAVEILIDLAQENTDG